MLAREDTGDRQEFAKAVLSYFDERSEELEWKAKLTPDTELAIQANASSDPTPVQVLQWLAASAAYIAGYVEPSYGLRDPANEAKSVRRRAIPRLRDQLESRLTSWIANPTSFDLTPFTDEELEQVREEVRQKEASLPPSQRTTK